MSFSFVVNGSSANCAERMEMKHRRNLVMHAHGAALTVGIAPQTQSTAVFDLGTGKTPRAWRRERLS